MSARPNLSISAQWPFDVRTCPVYYGWVILVLSTLGFLMSIPGQTMGMGVFTNYFMDAFGLTRQELSIAYFVGTTASAALLPMAGRLYDRVGARLVLIGASALLGIFVSFLAIIDQLSLALAGPTYASGAALLLVGIGYFGVRFAGQGVLTSASRNLLLLWFVRRRGLVAGIRSLFVSFGFALAPLMIAFLISAYDWRNALWIMAGTVGIGFALLTLVFARNNPTECGLRADNDALDLANPPIEAPSKTMVEARRDPVFWLYSAGLAIHALFGTALTFHIVDIFQLADRSMEEAFRYFLPSAIVSTSTNFLASYLADSTRLKPLLILMLLAFITGGTGLLYLDHDWGYWMLVAGFGMGGGLWGVLSNLGFIRFFGPLHLGEISGLNASVTVTASAIGPLLFSVSKDQFGSYAQAQYSCILVLVVLLVAAIIIPQRELVPPPT